MAMQSSNDSGPFDDKITSPLCEICERIDWEHVLGGTLNEEAHNAFHIRHLYNLDGDGRSGATFLYGITPSIATIATNPTTCPLCQLWLRSYRRVYPDVDPAADSDGTKARTETSSFTYYVGNASYGRTWGGNPRGVDDDVQTSAARQKAMQAFRMRFRGSVDASNFEKELELTCLDEHLPPNSRSRGGRLLNDDCCRTGLYKQWLELCQADHGTQCESMMDVGTAQEMTSVVKLRLIDVNELKVVVGDFQKRYCALSYVWGTVETFKSTVSQFVEDETQPGEMFLDLKPFVSCEYGGTAHSSTQSPAALVPNTVIDAIEVTKQLGEQYLWVDAICIIQEPEELAAAVPHMDMIYKQALLTIVAASGDNSNAGLPRAHERAPKIQQIKEQVCNRTFMLAQPSLDIVFKRSTWFSRGWTFQEAKLSRRLLIFTDSGIYFRCQEDTWAEDSIEKVNYRPTGFRRAQKPGYSSRSSPLNTQDNIFADYAYDARLYSKRTLGHQTDALNAFMGLISDFQIKLLPTTFHWGLPQSRFDAALLWKAVDLWQHNSWAYRPPRDEEILYKEKQSWVSEGFSWRYEMIPVLPKLVRRLGFPSWSWCGWEGHLGYFPRTVNEPDLHLAQSIKSKIRWPWSNEDGAKKDELMLKNELEPENNPEQNYLVQEDSSISQESRTEISSYLSEAIAKVKIYQKELREPHASETSSSYKGFTKRHHEVYHIPSEYLEQEKTKHAFGDWETNLKKGILTFSAWVATVDFLNLPHGMPGTQANRGGWLGWPLDETDKPLLDGSHECVLLSRQLQHPIDYDRGRSDYKRVLDPIEGRFLVNIMVVGQGNDKKLCRRGIGLMREDIWWAFEPVWQLVTLE